MPAKRNQGHADATTRHALRAAMTAHELMSASATVILRRSAIGAAALERPTAAAFAEGSTMVTEKIAALAESGSAAAQSTADVAMAAVGYAVQEATQFGTAAGRLASCATPAAMLAMQQRVLGGFFQRFVTHSLAMGDQVMKASGAAMTPFHTAARANARRLTR